jgi:long-chain acyl-CoA synthetase
VPTRADVQAQLTGEGGMFEVVTEDVDGLPMKVYRHRMTSLREVATMGQARGKDEDYLVYGDRRYDFATFIDLANSVSATLAREFDVSHGDRVAVLSANNPEWCLAFWGTVNIGAILVGLNGWWKTDEVIYGLQDSASKVLVADRGRVQPIVDHLGELPDLEAVFLIDADPSEFGPAPDKRLHRFDELLARPGPALPTAPITEADAAVIFYTSGTTGRPKGAISTHRSMIANLQNTVYNTVAGAMMADAVSELAGAGKRQTASLLTSPMFHVSGCHSGIVLGLLAGVKLVIPVGKFEPTAAMQLIQDEGISIWATVPTMVWRVVEHPDRYAYDLSSITQVAYGGSPSAGELQRQVQATFSNLRTLGNAYGLTESASAIVINSGHDFLDRPDSVGLPMPTVEVKIVDSSAAALPSGATGELWVRGPQIMPGYWGKPEATAETLTDGWLHTGDVGFIDADGFVYITDRAKDMIIRGGENIYCVEIENRLVEHPDVLDAAVIGVPHPTLGEEVKAVVQVADSSRLDAAGLREWVAETLANFKVPAYVEVSTEKLPRNASGKLLKNVLRGQGEVSFDETM